MGTLALAGLPAPADAQAVGSEFQINTYTTSAQRTSAFGGHLIASDADGNFVVVWSSVAQDGHGYGVFGQRYDSEGVPLGTEFRVNSYTTSNQYQTSVASDANGNFVVVWASQAQDGDNWGVFGQRFDIAGAPQGNEFRVNSYTTLEQRFASVASDASGNFVVVWTSYSQDGSGSGIFGQRYDGAGVALGGEFRVNSFTTSSQAFPSVASDATGNFVVVWSSYGQDSQYWGVFGQRYDSAGVAQGAEFQVNTYGVSTQRSPSVASDANGNFVIVWTSYYNQPGIYGRRYDSGGVALGSEFRVKAGYPGNPRYPSVASDASGNFVVVWQHSPQDAGTGIFGQRYDSEGVAQGGEFPVNSYTTGFQKGPSVWATGTNQFVVAWESLGQDGSGYGVFGQRFDAAAGAITVVSPNTNVKWRIGSVQRIKWTHNLGLNTTFRIELDRDDDGTFEELIAAAAPVDSATKGSFAWTVTGPPSPTARVRVSWTTDPAVSDSSDVTFQIRPA